MDMKSCVCDGCGKPVLVQENVSAVWCTECVDSWAHWTETKEGWRKARKQQ